MFPTLVDFGTWHLPFFGEVHLFLPTYGILFALSVVAAWWWFTRNGRALGVPDELLFNLSFYSLLAGIVGAKLLLVLLDLRFYLSNPAEIVGTLRSAGVLAGGVIAGALCFALYAKRNALPLLALGDAVAPALALAQGIGRLGCFGAGCCWGVPADPSSPVAIVFTDPLAGRQTGVPLNVPLVPVQLIQAMHDLALAVVLAWLWHRRPRPAGTVFWTYLLLYGLGRGVLELWRGDVHRGIFFGGIVSTSQLFSLAAVLLGLAMLLRGRLRRRGSRAAAP